MQQSNSAKPVQSPAKPPKEVASKDMHELLEERSHVFENRHWVNEACGDDLWEI